MIGEVKIQEEEENRPIFDMTIFNNNPMVKLEGVDEDEELPSDGEQRNGEENGQFKRNWMEVLAVNNNIPLNDIVSWSEELRRFLFCLSPITKEPIHFMIFKSFKEVHDLYIASIFDCQNGFCILKLRDKSGFIIFFKMIKTQDIVSEVVKFNEKLPKRSNLLIFMENGESDLFLNIRKVMHNKNPIFVSKKQYSLQIWQKFNYQIIKEEIYNILISTKTQVRSGQGSQTKVWHWFYTVHQQFDNSIYTQVFGPNFINVPYDRLFLINYLVKTQLTTESINHKSVARILQASINRLKTKLQDYWRWSNDHFPKKVGPEFKRSCSWCKRRKSDTNCKGCFLITRKQVFLCIGNCFMNYHLKHQKLTRRDQTEELAIDIDFFDRKCKAIGSEFKKLQQRVNYNTVEGKEGGATRQDLTGFMGYLEDKLIHYFNVISYKKRQRELQERITEDQ